MKRKRSERGDSDVTDVLGRMTDLLMNGDAGNKRGKPKQPPTKKLKRSGINTVSSPGNVTPPSAYPTRSEPGNLIPQPMPHGTGEATPAPRQYQGYPTPQQQEIGTGNTTPTPRPYPGKRGPGNDTFLTNKTPPRPKNPRTHDAKTKEGTLG